MNNKKQKLNNGGLVDSNIINSCFCDTVAQPIKTNEQIIEAIRNGIKQSLRKIAKEGKDNE